MPLLRLNYCNGFKSVVLSKDYVSWLTAGEIPVGFIGVMFRKQPDFSVRQMDIFHALANAGGARYLSLELGRCGKGNLPFPKRKS